MYWNTILRILKPINILFNCLEKNLKKHFSKFIIEKAVFLNLLIKLIFFEQNNKKKNFPLNLNRKH